MIVSTPDSSRIVCPKIELSGSSQKEINQKESEKFLKRDAYLSNGVCPRPKKEICATQDSIWQLNHIVTSHCATLLNLASHTFAPLG